MSTPLRCLLSHPFARRRRAHHWLCLDCWLALHAAMRRHPAGRAR